jgi:UDP-N-acetyl-D-mannosaminuronic acid transferase (WecB/TagA/CpsF family)
MVLLWRMLHHRRVNRVSGLKYLQQLFDQPELRVQGGLFMIVPSEVARERAENWLAKSGFPVSGANMYIAPFYQNNVHDEHLVRLIESAAPAHVIVGLGGGTQERLGLYLREHLHCRPAIHCIGAALGFITGDQQPIPEWADRHYLGWLLRVMRKPRLFLGRYWKARKLPTLIWRYASELPPLKKSEVGS